jgi:Fe-S cluster assembly iron-binding protein IscA
MPNIQVTDKAKIELLKILKEHTEKKIRLFIQGMG